MNQNYKNFISVQLIVFAISLQPHVPLSISDGSTIISQRKA